MEDGHHDDEASEHVGMNLDLMKAPEMAPDVTMVDAAAADGHAVKSALAEEIGKVFREQIKRSGQLPNDFHIRKNSHPVVETEIYTSGFGLVPVMRASTVIPSRDYEMSRGPPDAFHLPPSWAPLKDMGPPETHRRARQVYNVFIPFASFSSKNSMALKEGSMAEKAFCASWEFFNRALCTRKMGSIDPEGGAARKSHRFLDVATKTVLPKFEVFGEVLVKDWQEPLRTYIAQHHPRATERERADPEWQARIVSEIGFRDLIVSPTYAVGIRYWVFIYDPKLDLGRAMQRMLWRNQVKFGVASPKEIVIRADALRTAWKEAKANEPAAAGAAAANDGDSDDAPAPELDAVDAAQAAQAKASKDAAAAEADRGEMGMGDDAPKPPRAPRQDPAVVLLTKQAVGLGLRIPSGGPDSRHPFVLHEIKQSLDDAEARWSQSGASMVIYRKNPADSQKLSDRDRDRALAGASGKRLAVVSVVSLKGVIDMVYSNLLNAAQNTAILDDLAKDIAQLDSETCDLGNFKNPYHPKHWFNFERINKAWQLEGRVCPHQCDIRYYFAFADPRIALANAFTFRPAIPSLIWHLTPLAADGNVGFESEFLRKHQPFMRFHCLQETLQALAVRKAERERVEEEERKEKVAMSHQQTTMAGLTAEHLIEILPHADEAKRAKIIADELKAEANYATSYSRKREEKFAKKYDGGASEFAPPTTEHVDQRFAEMGFVDGGEQLQSKAAKSVVVRDILGDAIEDWYALQRKVSQLCDAFPEEKPYTMRSLRDHQFDAVYKPLMHPSIEVSHREANKYGMGQVWKLHVAFLHEGMALAPDVVFPFVGMENLTYAASIIADFHLRTRTGLGITNGGHAHWAVFIDSNINCYNAYRAIGIHVQKIGAAGIGKSKLDDATIDSKVEHTTTVSIHTTTNAKLTENPCDNVLQIEDEASGASILDPSKATNQGDLKAALNLKNWLSSAKGKIGYSAFVKGANGERSTETRIVNSRGCLCNNTNIDKVTFDTSIKDRFVRYYLISTMDPTASQTQMLEGMLDPTANDRAAETKRSMQILDTLFFRLAQCINVGGAARPNVDDLIIHLTKALPKLSKYGVGSDSSLRRVAIGVEMGVSNTIALAVMQTFYGSGPTIRREYLEKGGAVKTEVRKWREDFIKECRPFLFMTEGTQKISEDIVWQLTPAQTSSSTPSLRSGAS
jgi:hypothetical protein